MERPVKTPQRTRAYDASGRQRLAVERRRRILRAALDRFSSDGYAGTAMADVAADAGVSLDTVYATVGRKPRLLLAVHDLVLGEGATTAEGEPLPALQRQYVADVQAAKSAREKLAVYAAALGRVLPQTAPLLEALREAGLADAECRRVWEEVERRRAANMRLLAADLRGTGELREELTDEDVADLIWSMNAAPYFLSLQRRGWTPERYTDLVRTVWSRTLLR